MRISAIFVTALALIGLAACEQKASSAAVLTENCVSSGESAALCDCLVKSMQTKLDPDLFARTAQAVGRDKQTVEAFIQTLPQAEQIAFSVVSNDLLSCAAAEVPPG
jgi:hypothetical protein